MTQPPPYGHLSFPGRPYFAYGANMVVAQVRRRCRAAALLGPAVLSGHRFVINQRGVATVIPDEFSTVHGILWMIDAADESALDGYEAVAEAEYRKDAVEVTPASGSERVSALIYLATDDRPGHPRGGYLEKIVQAAEEHGLPDGYIEELRQWLKYENAPPRAGATR